MEKPDGHRQVDRSSQPDQSDDMEQIRVKFCTDVEKYKVPEASIALPLTLGRLGLSKIINHLLQLEEVVPFDFLIKERNVLVRQKLEKHVSELKLSKEDVLVLEYAPAFRPPEFNQENEKPDWISSIDARNGDGIVASGSYDGKIYLFRILSKTLDSKRSDALVSLGAIAAHERPVKAVCQIGDIYVASGSKNGSVKMHRLDSNDSQDDQVTTSLAATFEGHVGSVESVCGFLAGDHAVLASAGWDKAVCIWKADVSGETQASVSSREYGNKSRRVSGESKRKTDIQTIQEPSSLFLEHLDCVSCLCWEQSSSPNVLYSGSWDHSIRAWDTTRECESLKLKGTKVVSSLAHSMENQLLASGHPDHVVRLWDARVTGDSIVKLTFGGHKGWVSAVRWSPVNSNIFASASHDKTVKIWDIRSPGHSLHSIDDHVGKCLAIDWDSSGTHLLSGGADSKLRLYKL